MNIRRIFDRIQIGCHLLGLHRLANFVGRFGSPVIEVKELSFEDRPTIECPVYIPPSARSENCSLDEVENCGPLKALDFDPTFNKNSDIDISRDIMFPSTKLDIN